MHAGSRGVTVIHMINIVSSNISNGLSCPLFFLLSFRVFVNKSDLAITPKQAMKKWNKLKEKYKVTLHISFSNVVGLI